MFSPVKYQNTGDNICWHRLHVSLSTDVYEKALDLRKVRKMSVSYLIARAIELYLDQVGALLAENSLKTPNSDTDNYDQEYVFIASKFNGLLNFTVFWCTPPEPTINKYINNHTKGYYLKRR